MMKDKEELERLRREAKEELMIEGDPTKRAILNVRIAILEMALSKIEE